MVRNARAADYEATPRPIIAVGNDYPAGHHHPPHRHRRWQLLYAASGIMVVGTAHGAWVVPPQRAVWVPGGTRHEIRMIDRVTTRSVYVEPDAATELPRRCQVVGISPLVRRLLLEAVDLPAEYEAGDRAGLIMALLLHELQQLPILPLCVPFPQNAKLAEQCRAFMSRPGAHGAIDDWSSAAGMSRRGFTRLFRRETGLSLSAWRQQACAVASLPRLAAGDAVTTVALDMGYGSPEAFTKMFKRVLGVPPSRYFSNEAREP
jgi:AraC-like DNA-binding protein/mannose-6-phosphate isomerase-like protein (cupin superfamily)